MGFGDIDVVVLVVAGTLVIVGASFLTTLCFVETVGMVLHLLTSSTFAIATASVLALASSFFSALPGGLAFFFSCSSGSSKFSARTVEEDLHRSFGEATFSESPLPDLMAFGETLAATGIAVAA